MRDTIPVFGEFLRSSRVQRIATCLAYLTVVGTLLDILTTVMVFSMSGREVNPTSIRIIEATGLVGWVALRIEVAATFLFFGLGFGRYWAKFPYPLCLLFLVAMSYFCVVFGVPFFHNLRQL